MLHAAAQQMARAEVRPSTSSDGSAEGPVQACRLCSSPRGATSPAHDTGLHCLLGISMTHFHLTLKEKSTAPPRESV